VKLILIGDPHLKISKFDISCQFLLWVCSVVEHEKPDLVVNLGDTFDTHSIVRAEILSEFRKHAKRVAAVCPYFYNLGNHDMYKPNDSKYHALEALKDIKNFKVIDRTLDMPTFGITFVPYIHDYKQFPMQTQPICIAHQTFVGADYGYYRPDVGVDADKVSAEIIISGHIHKRQGFGKVIYPGTPFAQGVDDINQSKGVMVFDTDTYDYRFIESPFPGWKGLRFEVSQDLDMNSIHEQIVSSINTIDNWMIEIVGPKAELLGYIDSKLTSELRKEHQIRFKPVYNDKEKQMKVSIKASSMENALSEYVDKVYQGSIDKALLRIKALEVLKKVRSV
jgi:DNA repair exonuclease SbcCD nuclease subunit